MNKGKLQLLKQKMKKKKQQAIVGAIADIVASKQLISQQESQGKGKPSEPIVQKQELKQQQQKVENLTSLIQPPAQSIFKSYLPAPVTLIKTQNRPVEQNQIQSQPQPKLILLQAPPQISEHQKSSNSQQKHSPILLQNPSEQLKHIQSQKQKSGQNLSFQNLKGNNFSQNPSVITDNHNRVSIDQPLNVEKQKLIKLTRYLLKDVEKIKETVANIEGSLKGLEYIKNRIKIDKLFGKKIKQKMHILKNIAEL